MKKAVLFMLIGVGAMLLLLFYTPREGLSQGRNITGGNLVVPEEWPFVVQVFGNSACIGSVIHASWVLTAAHCVENAAASDIGGVWIYTPGRLPPPSCPEGCSYMPHFITNIGRVILHPSYDPNVPNILPDAALVEILDPIPASARSPVRILAPEEETRYAPIGTAATLIGDDGGRLGYPTEDNYWIGGLVLRSPEECLGNSLWGSISINEYALCAGFQDVTNVGDSGGPYVVPLPDGSWGQVGIHNLSAKLPQSASDFPPVLTRTSAIYDWIRDQIGGFPDFPPIERSGDPGSFSICNRTPEVQDAILRQIGSGTTCENVTAADLETITGSLDLSDQGIVSLKAGDFDGLTNLQQLSFSIHTRDTSVWNRLSTLPVGVFNGLTNLQSLSIQWNRLTTLRADVFSSLTNLQTLRLGSNLLTTLPVGVFSSLTNLQSLALGGNRLTTLPVGVFSSLTNLQSLALGGNRLTTLRADVFNSLTNLQVLYLNSNALTGLPADVFSSLTNLQKLYLQNNALTTLPGALLDDLQARVGLEVDLQGNPGYLGPGTFDFARSTVPVGAESFSIPDRGGQSITSGGTTETLRVGYGRIRPDAGSTTPSGIAIFQFRDSEGVLISEAGVPAAAPVLEGRIFAEVNGPVNTGLAIANPNDGPAFIQFYFTDTSGTRFAEGSFDLGAHEQTAKFLDQPPFNGGGSVLGTLTFTSSVPIAAIALRGFTNEAGEFLMTTLPVAPLSSTASDTVYFPHFADGSGWVTQVILVNPTDRTITGTVGFLGPGSGTVPASPVILALADGRTGSSFDYSIPARSAQRFTTSNPAGGLAGGSVRATPSSGNAAPSGLVVFSYVQDGTTVSEAGVPALPKGTAFRTYVEASGTPEQAGSIRSGLAITNTAATSNTVTLEVTRLDGSLAAAPKTLSLPPSGQVARFLDEIFSLPDNFSGVLRVTSTADVAMVALRLRVNERGELKMTTTSPSNEMDPSTSEDRFFAHLADSVGWSTQFILFSGTAGQNSSGTLSLTDAAGKPLEGSP